MLSPYELENIDNVSAYILGNEKFSLYSLKADKCLIGSAYENLNLIRALSLKFEVLNESLTEEIYSSCDSNEVFFIIEYTNTEKYIISFQLKEQDEESGIAQIKKIKEQQEDILKWFRYKLEVKDQLAQDSDLIVFPSYSIPSMPAVINLEHNHEYVKISSVELSSITVLSNNDELTPKTINFKVGKREYPLEVVTLTKHKLESGKIEFKLKIQFSSIDNFHTWNRFILAMDLKPIKAND